MNVFSIHESFGEMADL